MNNLFPSLRNASVAIQFAVMSCLFLFGLFSSATLIALLSKSHFLQSHTYINQVVILAISSIGTFLLPSYLWIFFIGDKFKVYLKLNLPQRNTIFLWSFILVFVSLPFVQYTAFINQQISLPQFLMGLEKKASDQLKSLLDVHTPVALVINILLIGILPGIVEELFFRGVLQRTIYDATHKMWLSIFIVAFVFSFLHLQFQGFLPRMILGILLGIIFQYSNSILPSMVFHAIFNTFQLILYYSLNIHLDKVNMQEINAWSLLALATISVYASYLILCKKIRMSAG